eukprot:Phypoly_transcript_24471.p1 GENE.Phypoly_transcript_24471~~Phypoly_transcript_24471.p1  ORF type:complete len:139 (+),score=22.56 Phypoly_transcript_24471:1-417(+)
MKIETWNGAPNTQAFREHFGESLTQNGFLKVRETMQIAGHDHIFAMGDIADVTMNKTAVLARTQVKRVVQSIKEMVQGKPALPLRFFLSYSYPTFITLGSEYGVGVLPFFGGISFGSSSMAHLFERKFKEIVEDPGKA